MEDKAQVKYIYSNSRDLSGHFKRSFKKKSKANPTIIFKQLMCNLEVHVSVFQSLHYTPAM